MTKYQIISPNGVKVCVIEAMIRVVTPDGTFFYNHAINKELMEVQKLAFGSANLPREPCANIPAGWAAIPVDVIVKEDVQLSKDDIKDIAIILSETTFEDADERRKTKNFIKKVEKIIPDWYKV